MMEIWKDIKDYEGLYQVSNLGRVKSLNYNKTGREQVLKPTMDVDGYLRLTLYKDGKQKFGVHRLVAEAFIPNPENLPQINHKDEDKTNNCIWNLEWCDSKYNNNYGTRNEKTRQKLINNKKRSLAILQICQYTNKVIAEFPSVMEAERKTGFMETAIRRCCKGKTKTSYGYKWQYKEVI